MLLSEIYNSIEKFTYKQLFLYFEFTVVLEHKYFIVVTNKKNTYLLHANNESHQLECVDLYTYSKESKSIIFIANVSTLDTRAIENNIQKVTYNKEYSFSGESNFYHCITIYFQNKLINTNQIPWPNLLNVMNGPLFSGQISQNHTTGLYSIPMFSDSLRNVINFCDFKDSFYEFRKKDIFSFWADSNSLNNGFDGGGNLTMLISFNPLSLLEASMYLVSNQREKIIYSLFQTPVTFDKVFQYSSAMPLFQSKRIIFCYSHSSPFYLQDSINTLSFVLNMINFMNVNFVFSDCQNIGNKINVYLIKYPQGYSLVDFDDMVTFLNKMVREQFSTDPALSDKEIYSNYSLLEPFIFQNSSYKMADKRRIFCLSFSAIPDLIFILLSYLKGKFELNYDYSGFSGSLLFQTSPL